jgi:hypothetical protein
LLAQVLRCLLGRWELLKRSFDGTGELVLDLPFKLARALHDYKTAHYAECGADTCVAVCPALLAALPRRANPALAARTTRMSTARWCSPSTKSRASLTLCVAVWQPILANGCGRLTRAAACAAFRWWTASCS